MKFIKIKRLSDLESSKQRILYSYLKNKLEDGYEIFKVSQNGTTDYTTFINDPYNFLALNMNGLAICEGQEGNAFKGPYYTAIAFYDTSNIQDNDEEPVYHISRHNRQDFNDGLGDSSWFELDTYGNLIQTDKQLNLFNSTKNKMTRNEENINKIFSEIKPVNPVDNIDRTKDDLIHRNDYENNNRKEKTESSKFDRMLEEEQKKLANSLTIDEFDEILKENVPYRHEIIKNYQLAKEGNEEAWKNVKAMIYNEPIPASFYQRFWLPKINDVEEQLFSSKQVIKSGNYVFVASIGDASIYKGDDNYLVELQKDFNSVEEYFDDEQSAREFAKEITSSKTIKSSYTREDYDRFDEMGNFIPYQPTSEEFAKKDEIKKVLEQELSDAYEPDPMDDYVGYDSTNERVDMACERIAKQFGVDTDFVNDIAREIDYEGNVRQMIESDWVYEHCNDKDKFYEWLYEDSISLEELGINVEQMNREVDKLVRNAIEKASRPVKSSFIKSSKYIVEVGDDSVEFDNLKEANETFRQAVENNDSNTTIKIYVDEGYSNKHLKLMDSERGRLNSSFIKSSYEDTFTVYPWSDNVTGTSDEDLGLSYVLEVYGDEFVNVDDDTLTELKDTLVRYFDEDEYVRVWNLNNPDYQIEDVYEVVEPEDMTVNELAMYFDYDAYGRNIRLEHNMVWDSEEECWVSAHDVDDNDLNDDKYILRG